MIRIEQTRDFDLIRRIFTDPAVYPMLTEDGAPAPADFRPVEHEGIWYVAVLVDEQPVGIWMLVPHSVVCYEIHTALLPCVRGREALEASRLFAEWLWSSTPCQRLITNVPGYNRPAVFFSKMAGMKRFGVNEKAFMKNGKLHDLIMFGISKPGVS